MFVWRRAWLCYLNIQSYHTIIFCYIGKKINVQFVNCCVLYIDCCVLYIDFVCGLHLNGVCGSQI